MVDLPCPLSPTCRAGQGEQRDGDAASGSEEARTLPACMLVWHVSTAHLHIRNAVYQTAHQACESIESHVKPPPHQRARGAGRHSQIELLEHEALGAGGVGKRHAPQLHPPLNLHLCARPACRQGTAVARLLRHNAGAGLSALGATCGGFGVGGGVWQGNGVAGGWTGVQDAEHALAGACGLCEVWEGGLGLWGAGRGAGRWRALWACKVEGVGRQVQHGALREGTEAQQGWPRSPSLHQAACLGYAEGGVEDGEEGGEHLQAGRWNCRAWNRVQG